MKKGIAILGSTGSIGTQALEVIRNYQDNYTAEVLTAWNNADLLIKQALEFQPNSVVIGNEALYNQVFEALNKHDIKVFAGEKAISEIVEMSSVDIVLAAIVGFAGLTSTYKSLLAGKTVALANKETLVVAGEMITSLAEEKNISIFPVDSEHSAILQCITGEFFSTVEKVILTASGGPFRGKTQEYLATVSKEDALKHPNWSMGDKITIDSASLMNKGLEVIEAKWLFNLKPEQIEVVIHPQSIIHSMVQFCDGSVKAQLGMPDMRLPINYAFSYPKRFKSDFPRLDMLKHSTLTFEKPDKEAFRNLDLAYNALYKGGNMPCILNASNEIAVNAFLKGRLSFPGMSLLIEKCMDSIAYISKPNMNDYYETDNETRIFAEYLISENKL